MPDLNKIIDDLSKLTVIEAAELSKKLEEKWGVTAATAAVMTDMIFFDMLMLFGQTVNVVAETVVISTL